MCVLISVEITHTEEIFLSSAGWTMKALQEAVQPLYLSVIGSFSSLTLESLAVSVMMGGSEDFQSVCK